MDKLVVRGTEINVQWDIKRDDFLSLTDIAKIKDSDNPRYIIQNWLRNRNTIEFLGVWETLYNPDFNRVEFDAFRSQAGLNSFVMTPQKWVDATGAVGIVSKAGRYGGTYAHKEIAFEFASWISVEFKLYLVKEFERLKTEEMKQLGWDIKRNLAKINYRIHTDAIKENLIPPELSARQISLVYASEADVLNMALFGMTAKEWRDAHPDLKGNIRDYACDAKTADSEFLLSKRQYRQLTGREQASDVIAYQIRQSFKPGEVTPEEANRLGYEFARRFTKGDHAFIVCTHTDKKHIHNHIIWNSTTLDCTRKFRNFWGSTEAVRKLSDLVCMEHRLSVIENPKPHGKSYNKWMGGNAKPCQRDLLRAAIDAALAQKPKDFEAFLKLVEAAGYTVKRGKHVTFMRDGQSQNIRLRSLGEGYSEEELRAVILGTRVHTPRRKKTYSSKPLKPTLISQIEAKIGSGKGTAYDQKLKVIKLKSMAETLLFIQKHDFADFDALADYADAASAKTKELTAKIKAAESRMAEIAVLKTHIINYAKTRDVYTAYRKAGYSRKYYDAHESDIIIHKAAKKAFDDLALKKLPTVKSLQAEYSNLLVQKKLDYAALAKVRDEAKQLQIYKANAELLLRTDAEEQRQTKEHQQEK